MQAAFMTGESEFKVSFEKPDRKLDQRIRFAEVPTRCLNNNSTQRSFFCASGYQRYSGKPLMTSSQSSGAALGFHSWRSAVDSRTQRAT
jgi:hypothetical protein